jgi:AcrR family transcriptional regulator
MSTVKRPSTSTSTPPRRPYDGRRRKAQAEATRQEVLDAAGALFASAGYAATSIDAIATRAGVSRETIFKSFGGKRQLLQLWVEREVAGPDEPIPIEQQRWVERVRLTENLREQAAIAAAAVTAIYERAVDALMALRAAAHADAEIAELWANAQAQRRRDVENVGRSMIAPGRSKHGRNTRELVDIMYMMTSPEVFELYVRQSGWTPEHFRQWLTSELTSLVAQQP